MSIGESDMAKRIDQMVKMMQTEAEQKAMKITADGNDKQQSTKTKLMVKMHSDIDEKFKKDTEDRDKKTKTYFT